MLDWNGFVYLSLGAVALCILCGVWFLIRLASREPVPLVWWLSLCCVLFVAVIACVASQVVFVTKLSTGSTVDSTR